jgi:hypothetical protein
MKTNKTVCERRDGRTVAMIPVPPSTMFCFIILACILCTQLLKGKQSAV